MDFITDTWDVDNEVFFQCISLLGLLTFLGGCWNWFNLGYSNLNIFFLQLKKNPLYSSPSFFFDSYCKLATYVLDFASLIFVLFPWTPVICQYLGVLAGACSMTQCPLSWSCQVLDLDNFRTKALNLT